MLQGLLHVISVLILSAGPVSALANSYSENSDDISLIPFSSAEGFAKSPSKDSNFEAQSYYTVDEASPIVPGSLPLVNPLTSLTNSLESAAKTTLSEKAVVLTRWIKHAGSPGSPKEPYNRLKHFGRWINDPTDTECLDTRAKVLERDSLVPVKFKGNNRCRVASGLWKDPYAGKTITDARDIQIDHFVPLKDAYISGGWKWTPLKRCLYSNYMSNDYHLLSVYGTENMIKSDSSPEDYIPPNTGFVCEYLERWLKVKLIWNLNMKSSEAEAIRNEFQRYNCDLRAMKMSRKELAAQRSEILSKIPICEKKPKL